MISVAGLTFLSCRMKRTVPTEPAGAEDGVAAVALGLGRTVVEGETCLRFCPRYPKHVVQFSSVQDVLNNSQRHFYALRLDDPPETGEHSEVSRLGLATWTAG